MESNTISEGKTKIIVPLDAVRLKAKEDITAGNGAMHDLLSGKALIATRTTSNVFSLLKHFGIPVAFYAQDEPDSFIAPRCRMLPWEVVVRWKAYGSYLKRHPEMQKGQEIKEGSVIVEFFLKTSQRKWRGFGLQCDDPLASFMSDGSILLFNPDLPDIKGTHFLRLRANEVNDYPTDSLLRDEMEKLARAAFNILRAAWRTAEVELVDMKVEFGIGPDGELFLADVIDNDSWRLIWKYGHLDKQLYRDGADIKTVLTSYRRVMESTDQFSQRHEVIRAFL